MKIGKTMMVLSISLLFVYAVAFLFAFQIVMSFYKDCSTISSTYIAHAAETLLAKSSSTTAIPAGRIGSGTTTSTKKTPSWEIWDRKSVLPSHTEGHECRWTDYHFAGKTVPMCVHPQSDIISNRIVRNGSYGHCNHLVNLWEEAESAITATIIADNGNFRNRKNRDMLFVDIGANIGACILTVLLSTSPYTKIVAFEPSPDNQFCLTSTLMSLPPDLRDRVYFYPIALGGGRTSTNTPSISKLYSQRDNMGNSVIHKMTGIKESAIARKVNDPVVIVIEPLEQIIKMHRTTHNSVYGNIPLVKIDGQGFECEILKGMESTLPFVGSLTVDVYGHSETSHSHQTQFGCNASYIFVLLKKYQFRIYINGKETTIPLPEEQSYEIVAKRFSAL